MEHGQLPTQKPVFRAVPRCDFTSEPHVLPINFGKKPEDLDLACLPLRCATLASTRSEAEVFGRRDSFRHMHVAVLATNVTNG